MVEINNAEAMEICAPAVVRVTGINSGRSAYVVVYSDDGVKVCGTLVGDRFSCPFRSGGANWTLYMLWTGDAAVRFAYFKDRK